MRTIESYLAASNVETEISWINSAQFEPSENSTSKFMKLSYACFCCCANYFRLSYFSVVPHCREVTFIYYSSLEVVSLALYMRFIKRIMSWSETPKQRTVDDNRSLMLNSQHRIFPRLFNYFMYGNIYLNRTQVFQFCCGLHAVRYPQKKLVVHFELMFHFPVSW